MDYSTLPMTFHGLEWALLRGLMYGLVLLLTLWGAGTVLEWGIRVEEPGIGYGPPTGRGLSGAAPPASR